MVVVTASVHTGDMAAAAIPRTGEPADIRRMVVVMEAVMEEDTVVMVVVDIPVRLARAAMARKSEGKYLLCNFLEPDAMHMYVRLSVSITILKFFFFRPLKKSLFEHFATDVFHVPIFPYM